MGLMPSFIHHTDAHCSHFYFSSFFACWEFVHSIIICTFTTNIQNLPKCQRTWQVLKRTIKTDGFGSEFENAVFLTEC